jgi:uncharacterized protein YodC (DUF2158 family)
MDVNDVKVGETVRLRAGGPLMTVDSLNNEQAMCVWFERDGEGGWGTLRAGQFRFSIIEAVASETRTRGAGK